MKILINPLLLLVSFSIGLVAPIIHGAEAAFCETELIFPLESWHNHASCVVELSDGSLLAVWFHGSGERTADDVRIEGSRLRRDSQTWSPRFVIADTPGYPDCNPALFIDPQNRLWLLWPTILANTWESALMKYKISSDYLNDGPPKWLQQEIMHITPGVEFQKKTLAHWDKIEKELLPTIQDQKLKQTLTAFLPKIRQQTQDKLFCRLGWMTRAHPFILENRRLIVPLYSDGFDFSLMAITDDWGNSWQVSTPLTGAGNIQPSIVRRNDGTLYTLMRDNGPPPQRLMQSESKDNGETWSPVTDSNLPNPGSGAEIIQLKNGHWILISNDTEEERNQLAVQISEDEGKTWPWKRYLEKDAPGPEAGRYHYPSIIQSKDGSLHATYSYHLHKKTLPRDVDGDPAGKSIKHAHFNEAWIRAGK